MLKFSDKIPKRYSNQKVDPEEETIDIDLQGVGLHKVYDWLPYTFFRVQRMLDEIGCYAENIWQGYKQTADWGTVSITGSGEKKTVQLSMKKLTCVGCKSSLQHMTFLWKMKKHFERNHPKPGEIRKQRRFWNR